MALGTRSPKAKSDSETARATGEYRKETLKRTFSPNHGKHLGEQAAKAEAKEAKQAKLSTLREGAEMPPPALPASVLHQKGLATGKKGSTTPPKTVQFSLATPVATDEPEQPRLTSPKPMAAEVPDPPFLGTESLSSAACGSASSGRMPSSSAWR